MINGTAIGYRINEIPSERDDYARLEAEEYLRFLLERTELTPRMLEATALYLDGLSPAEMREVLGVSRTQVDRLVMLAAARLRLTHRERGAV